MLDAEHMELCVSQGDVPDDLVFVEALFAGTKDDPAVIRERMNALVEQREASQPVKSRTGGSTFKNPDTAVSGGRKAWQLIDEAGCRGSCTAGRRYPKSTATS